MHSHAEQDANASMSSRLRAAVCPHSPANNPTPENTMTTDHPVPDPAAHHSIADLLAAVAEQLPPDDPAKCAMTLAGMTTPSQRAAATARTASPEQVSAILRSDGPLYPSRIGVFCAGGGTVVEGEYVVSEKQTKAERLEVARTHLRDAGWQCDGEGDFCPTCQIAGGES